MTSLTATVQEAWLNGERLAVFVTVDPEKMSK